MESSAKNVLILFYCFIVVFVAIDTLKKKAFK